MMLNTTVAQNPMVLKRTIASWLKDILSKKEYTTTQTHIRSMEPTTAIQVITVQYFELRPTKMLAEKMAAIATVVPKSANESSVLPDQEN